MAVAGHPTAVAQTALEAAAEQAEQEVMRRARAAARRESAEPAPPSVPQTARVRPAEPPSRPPSAGANGQQVTPAPGPRPAPGEPPPTKSQTGALQSVTISPEVFAQVWRRAFARPETPPSPAANPLSEAKVALGARLFSDKRLSSDHKSSCATCHDPARGFVDGRPRAIGKRGQTLARNTPPLWNLAWARKFGWDGSITTHEAVVKAQIERDDSMDATLEAGALWASRDASYAPAFARAFPERPQPTPQAVADALASYVRSVVSPQSRFDRWVAGDDRALAPEERAGFEVFTGKGQCVSCHAGWRLTDDSLHTSGGSTIRTPSLREVAWTAPYGMDGAAPTLAGFLLRHRGAATLSAAERERLVAFLRAVSSDKAPREAGAAAR